MNKTGVSVGCQVLPLQWHLRPQLHFLLLFHIYKNAMSESETFQITLSCRNAALRYF